MALPLDADDGDDGDGDELACGRCEAATAGVVGIVDVDVDVEAGTACDGLRGVLLGAMTMCICGCRGPEEAAASSSPGQRETRDGTLLFPSALLTTSNKLHHRKCSASQAHQHRGAPCAAACAVQQRLLRWSRLVQSTPGPTSPTTSAKGAGRSCQKRQ